MQYSKGDRVWLKNANGGVMMTGNTHSSRREITFTVVDILSVGDTMRYVLDTHNSDARRRYCGSIGVTADSLMRAEA